MSLATRCRSCGSSLPIDAAFCPRCGESRPPVPPLPLPRRLALGGRRWGRAVVRAARGVRYCAACRLPVPADAAFCIRCAADLASPPPPAAEAPGRAGAGLTPFPNEWRSALWLPVLGEVLSAAWLAGWLAWAPAAAVDRLAAAVRAGWMRHRSRRRSS